MNSVVEISSAEAVEGLLSLVSANDDAAIRLHGKFAVLNFPMEK